MPSVDWKRAEDAPRDLFNIAAAITLTCDCGRGARMVIVAGRLNGKWVVPSDFEHEFVITHYCQLPPLPETIQ